MTPDTNAQPKRVAVIYHYFAHYRQPVLLQLLEHGRHHYEFLANDHSYDTGIKLTDRIPDERFHKVAGKFLGPFLFQFGAVKAALGSRYDTLIMLGNPTWPTTWLAAILGRIRGKQILFWTHGWLKEESGTKALFRTTFNKLAHGLLLYGHRAKDLAIKAGIKPERLHVIYNSLDCELQDEARARIQPTDRVETRNKLFAEHADRPVLINITRLQPHKRLDLLIDAAAILKEQGKPVNVLIVGDGEERQALEQRAQEQDVTAVFTGALYEEYEIGCMLNAADIAVMPGPVGLLVMHALAYGVPVITNNNFDTQMPEFEAIKQGLTGDFFTLEDLDSLVASIQRTLDSTTTYEQRYTQAREPIDHRYNPISQRILIERAIDGLPADDSFNAALPSYQLSIQSEGST
ncbi:MAG: glycosyltransferase [Phycisphaerales bacterium]|nr:glycosyltransferase [Phycisphaerales bacterium]